jgi:PAS domain S-box-containing protein
MLFTGKGRFHAVPGLQGGRVPLISVLYVDDEPALLEIGKIFLERARTMQVHTETSACHALEVLRRKSYDAVISDYQMPGMDGIGFLKVVRSSFGDIPFILFTGKGREEVAIQALNNGADYYLQKGGDTKAQFAELHHLLRQVVKQRRTEHALLEQTRQYEQVVKAQTEFICRFSPDGRHLFANDAYYHYFNKKAPDVLGKKFRPEVFPADQNRLVSHFVSLSRENPVSTIDHRIIMPDGAVKWQRWTDRAIFNYEGDLVEYQSVGRDITDIKQVEEHLRRKNEELSAAYEQIAAIEEELRQNYDELSQNERALRKSERDYRSVIESIQDVFYRSDREGRLVMASPSAAGLFGCGSVDELIGKDMAATFWKDREAHERFRAEITEKGSVTNYEIALLDAKGGTRYVSTNSHLYHDEQGNVLGDEGIVRDITAQKKSREALKESRDRLQAIVHGSPIPTFVLDREHRVISWNRALEEYSSVTAPEVLGKTEAWRAFYTSERPCLADFILEGDPGGMAGAYGKGCSRSPLIEGAYEATAFFPQMKDGVWLFFTAAPLLDGEGTVIGAVETLQDVTGKFRTETALREACEQMEVAFEEAKASEDMLLVQNRELLLSEQRYRNVVEDQTEFICRFLPDGRHVFVNEAYCRYFGKSREELLGRVFRPDIPPEDQELVRRRLDRLTPEEPVATVVHRVILPDGSVRWHRWSDRAIFRKGPDTRPGGSSDPGGSTMPPERDGSGSGRPQVIEYQSVGRDITDVVIAEEALRQGNRKLTLLNSITRHDILNKVLVVHGQLDLLREAVSPGEIPGIVAAIAAATDDITEQIEFTKVYQEVGIREPEWQDPERIIRCLPVPAHVSVTCDLGGAEVCADPMFEKVLYNLLENSLRHGETVTKVRVSAVPTGEGLVVAWEDNGTGISDNDRKHLFQKGFGRHTGLGLFLAREVLSITGITIRETGSEGTGARFEMVVPPGMFRTRASGTCRCLPG